ncbi:hypothetical protein CUJ88_41080 [Paraburkholderia hospita]|nr:hypothetical protein CUJ88_41080 [Paraburkholderia hospita]
MNRHREKRESMNGHAAPTPASKPVRWTDEEAQRVAHASYRILNAESISSIEAVQRGQAEVLSPERHRAIRQMKDIESAIIPIWKSLRAAEPEKQPDADASPSSTATEPVPVELQPAQTADAHVDAFVARAMDAQRAVGALTETETSEERKTMVRWTGPEKLIIARESKRLLASFNDMSPLDAIRKAVFGYLPESRHRLIDAISQVKWIHALWGQIDAVEQAEARERAAAADAAKADAVAEAVKPAETASLNPHDLSVETLIKAFAVKIGQQLMRGIGEQIQEAVMRQVINTLQGIPMRPGALPEGATRVHTPPRERKPRVAIVGLLNQQAEDVKRAFADAVEFTFIKSQQQGGSGGHGGAGMLARGSQADVVISMVDFTGHDVDAASKHLAVPFVRVNGSVSALKRWLSQWLNGEVALARQ